MNAPRVKRAYTKRHPKWKIKPGAPSPAEGFAAAMAIVMNDHELPAEVISEAMNVAARLPKSGIFHSHRCWKCNDGERPCAQGGSHRCEYPRARNE